MLGRAAQALASRGQAIRDAAQQVNRTSPGWPDNLTMDVFQGTLLSPGYLLAQLHMLPSAALPVLSSTSGADCYQVSLYNCRHGA